MLAQRHSKLRCSPQITAAAAAAPSLPAYTSPSRQDDKRSKDSSGKLDKISKLDKAEEEEGQVDERSATDSHGRGVKERGRVEREGDPAGASGERIKVVLDEFQR